ncbi:hypothetical protein ACT4V6_11500 [Acinetobacter baumannii]
MALDLSKIKSEANKDQAEEIRVAKNQKKISEGVDRHRENLKNWFISLFPEENMENNSYMETSFLFNGETRVSLIFQLVAKTPNGNMLQAHNKVDFLFQKTKKGNVVASTVFVDITDYLSLDPESKNYEYSYTVKDKIIKVKFSELEQFLQHVIDK